MSDNLPSLTEISKEVKTKIIGQDEMVDKVTLTIFHHILKTMGEASGYKTDFNSNLLIIGGSGTGKTMTVRAVAKAYNHKLIELNAKTFSQEGGWHGDSFTKQVDDLWGNSYSPIIFIDEFDKIIRPNHSDKGDINLGLQQGLLKFLEGMKTPKRNDLSNACFILAGAFTEIVTPKAVNKMGFFTQPDIDKTLIEKKLLDYGIIEELLGRINRIVISNPINKDVLKRILYNKDNVFNQYLMLLAKLDLKLPECNLLTRIDVIIDKALAMGLGVRGLNHVLMEEMDKLIEEQFKNDSITANANPYSIHKLS